MSDPDYPNVRCNTHGRAAPGYCVCVHVAREGAAIAHEVPASALELGEVLCARCHAQEDPITPAQLILMCAWCVETLYEAHR